MKKVYHLSVNLDVPLRLERITDVSLLVILCIESLVALSLGVKYLALHLLGVVRTIPHTTRTLLVHQPTMFADTPASLQILNLLDRSSGNK
jgi:hypothetical protein